MINALISFKSNVKFEMHCKENNPNQVLLLDQIHSEFSELVLPFTVFVGFEIGIGFFGNLLILYVFIFRYHSCNFRTFVICLSIIDILCTLTTMPAEMVTQSFRYKYPYPKLCKAKDFFNVSTVFAENLCLLVIAIDRYRKVCRPLKWQIKPKVAVILCVVSIFIASVVAVPVTIFLGTICKDKTVGNTTITVRICEKDEEYKNSYQLLAYQIVAGSFVFLSLLSMFVMYLRIANTLIRERQNSVSQAPLARRTRKKTVIMIILNGCFIVTMIIYYAMLCTLGSTEGIFEDLSNNNKVVFLFLLRFYFINHIINPILYCAIDPEVKEALHSMKSSINNIIPCSRQFVES